MPDKNIDLELAVKSDISQGPTSTIKLDEDSTKSFFPNNRILLMRAFSGITIRGYIADLRDENHPLKPRCFFKHSVDDEDRISLKMKLEFFNIPKKSGIWGQVSSSLLMRAHASFNPVWRMEVGEPPSGTMDIENRDKISIFNNTSCLVPEEEPNADFSYTNRASFSSGEQIADEIWNPCFDFCTVAGNIMTTGEFPDFSVLNDLEQETQGRFEPIDRILTYSGRLKPSDAAPRNG